MSTWVSININPLALKASIVLRIVPTFPGSCGETRPTPREKFSGLKLESGKNFDLTTARIPCGFSLRAIDFRIAAFVLKQSIPSPDSFSTSLRA